MMYIIIADVISGRRAEEAAARSRLRATRALVRTADPAAQAAGRAALSWGISPGFVEGKKTGLAFPGVLIIFHGS